MLLTRFRVVDCCSALTWLSARTRLSVAVLYQAGDRASLAARLCAPCCKVSVSIASHASFAPSVQWLLNAVCRSCAQRSGRATDGGGDDEAARDDAGSGLEFRLLQ